MNNLQLAVKFFHKHAGFSYDPLTETPAVGRMRCARELANAERDAASADIEFEWEVDQDADISWMDQEQVNDHYNGATCMMQCRAHRHGETLASLSGIHMSGIWGNDPYKRVVEAELAQEALATPAAMQDWQVND